MAVPSTTPCDSPSSRAAEYIAQDRFHRRFILPATADHGELQVSYADVGCTPPEGDTDTHHPTILFIPGMFASRYISVGMHAIAEKLGVRVLIIDRPGMGHSTDVPLPQRITTWIELVPLFLSHLNIKHVSLASHSAGTIYLFNTLIHCRSILHSTNPQVALIAPWVDPAHSHVATMQMVQYLPTTVFGVWHQIPKFAAAGGALFGEISRLLPSSSGLGNAAVETAPLERNRQRIEKDYGLSVELQKELATLSFKSIFGENTAGANSEALQCLRKGPAGLWGDCEDYGVFVGKLAGLERGQGNRGGGRLRICAYFAESDALIGKKGQRYMEDCWKGSGEEFEDVFKFTSTIVSETDHDSVVQSVECLEQIFIGVGGALPSSV